MAEAVSFKDRLAAFKDGLTGLREAVLVGLLLIVLFAPGSVAQWLRASQLSKVSLFGFSVDAREEVAKARDQTADVTRALADLETRARDAERQVAQLQSALAAAAATPVPMPTRAPAGSGIDAPAAPPAVTTTPAELSALNAQVERLSVNLARTRVLAGDARIDAQKTLSAQDRLLDTITREEKAALPRN